MHRITSVQLETARLIHYGCRTYRDIGRARSTSAGNVWQVVKNLKKKGLVSETEDRGALQLTQYGRFCIGIPVCPGAAIPSAERCLHMLRPPCRNLVDTFSPEVLRRHGGYVR